MKICQECYSANHRITPILKPRECLENHIQYICGTCGRCICINKDTKRKLQRWNFPFTSLATAILYVRTADIEKQTTCGIYELQSKKGRTFYKIFENQETFLQYLDTRKDVISTTHTPIFKQTMFRIFPTTQIRKLTLQEIEQYRKEQKEVITTKEKP